MPWKKTWFIWLRPLNKKLTVRPWKVTFPPGQDRLPTTIFPKGTPLKCHVSQEIADLIKGLLTNLFCLDSHPIGSMYGIFTYIYHQNQLL